MPRSNEKHRRNRLWSQDRMCYWCGKPTFIPPTPPGANKNGMATLDHIIARHHPAHVPGEAREIVLSCYLCNNERNRIETLYSDCIGIARWGAGQIAVRRAVAKAEYLLKDRPLILKSRRLCEGSPAILLGDSISVLVGMEEPKLDELLVLLRKLESARAAKVLV